MRTHTRGVRTFVRIALLAALVTLIPPAASAEEEAASAGWNVHSLKGPVKSVRITPFEGAFTSDDTVEKASPPRALVMDAAWASLDEMMDLPVPAHLYPSLIELSPRGRIVAQTVFDTDGSIRWKLECEYDEQGRVTVQTLTEDFGDRPIHVRYAYDEKTGKPVSVTPDAEDGSLETLAYHYDAQGRLVRYDRTELENRRKGQDWERVPVTTTRTYEYDAEDRLLSITTRDDRHTRTESYVYVPEERRRYSYRGNARPEKSTEYEEYDDAGRIIARSSYHVFSPGDVRNDLIEYIRDAAGRLVTWRDTATADGKVWIRESHFQFDGAGNMLRSWSVDTGGEEHGSRRFEYDRHGNWIRGYFEDIHESDHLPPEPAAVERVIEYYE